MLATDSSEEAALAAKTAADIAQETGSELYVVHARPVPVYIDPATDRISDVQGAEETVKGEAQQLLDTQVEQIKGAGGTVAEA